LGDVVTLAKPLVSYRVHGKNNGAMARLDKRRFAEEVRRARARFEFAGKLANAKHLPRNEAALDRSLTVLPYRLASLELLPEEHPVPRDATWKVLRDVALACVTPQGVPVRSRAALSLWRFSSGSRPALLTSALRALNVVKAA
jgi:hypothetical protein